MKYKKSEAKEYARANMRGLWIGVTTPFTDDREVDWQALRSNYRFNFDQLGPIGGCFTPTVIGESWSMTAEERKRSLEILVEEARGEVAVVAHISSESIRTMLELARHAADAGADYLTFVQPYVGMVDGDETRVYQWFAEVARKTEMGIIVFNLPRTGYSMRPEFLAKLVEIENLVAIKDPETREHVAATRKAAGNLAVTCDCREHNWLDAKLDGQPAMVANGMPYLYQTPTYKPIAEYTRLLEEGKVEQARAVSASLEPLRQLHAKWTARGRRWGDPGSVYKAWIDAMNIGLVGGKTRLPLLDLPDEEREALRQDLIAVGLIKQPAAARR